MGRGRTGESLHGFVRAIVRDERLGADDRAVEAAAARIIAALDGVRRSPDWAELAAGGFEVPVMVLERDGQVEQIVEGVADAVVRTADGWRVLDWKTDAVSDAAWEERRPQYERQVARYAELLARLTGTHAEARLRRISLEEGA
jgi:ATP-dependent exoDNAse (exonuclease V) beta subunit